MGKVLAAMAVTNRGDVIRMREGIIPEDRVRSVRLENVLVDTGATTLCLPGEIIRQLDLEPEREVAARTASGVIRTRLFRDVGVSLMGREDTFSCVELPEGAEPLIGVIPLEALGIEVDLQSQSLRPLPMNSGGTYFTILGLQSSVHVLLPVDQPFGHRNEVAGFVLYGDSVEAGAPGQGFLRGGGGEARAGDGGFHEVDGHGKGQGHIAVSVGSQGEGGIGKGEDRASVGDVHRIQMFFLHRHPDAGITGPGLQDFDPGQPGIAVASRDFLLHFLHDIHNAPPVRSFGVIKVCELRRAFLLPENPA